MQPQSPKGSCAIRSWRTRVRCQRLSYMITDLRNNDEELVEERAARCYWQSAIAENDAVVSHGGSSCFGLCCRIHRPWPFAM